MKPVNLDSKPCSPISSNCVIWQGPDIPCINLCKGDTVSDVVAKLAEELCNVLDTLNVENYDLTCFGVNNCGPDDFEALINFLITKICELENISPEAVQNSNGCPTDCLVTVADCFAINGQTTMSLLDYVHLIGDTVCTIINDIAALDIKIESLTERVTLLEQQEDPTFTLPSFNSCLLGSVQPIDTILQNLETEYCALIDSTGTPADISAAAGRQCEGLDASPSRVSGLPMSVQYSATWITPVGTLADSVNNLWITLCDLRDQVIETVTVDVDDTDTVDMSITAGPNYVISANIADTGWVDLLGFDFMNGSTVRPQCRRIGSVIHFKGNAVIPLDNGAGSVVNFIDNFDYADNYSGQKTPYTGPGGVLTNSAGSLFFNNNNSVIPPSVYSGSLDDTYRQRFEICNRPIKLTDGVSTSLSAVLNTSITSAGKLLVTTIKDSEQIYGTYANAYPLRYITSQITAGEKVPDYLASNIHSDSAASPWSVQLPQDSSYVWPLTLDAADETHIGGFNIILDGLMAYI